jgi:hypothetical protein
LSYGTYKTNVEDEEGNITEQEKEGLFVNASFIKTGTLMVTNPEDSEEVYLSIDASKDGKGAFYAQNLSIEASGFTLSDNRFNFNIVKDDIKTTCLSFASIGSEETSYI